MNLHGAKTQKNIIFLAAVKTSNLARNEKSDWQTRERSE
jgi:hypothetical protein